MRTLQAGPTVRQSPTALALNYALAFIHKFSAAYSEYAWHYTGMLCEHPEASRRKSVAARKPPAKVKG